jgi:hypothetical protein
LEQFIFFQQMAVVFDQDEEQIEGFGLKRDALSVAQQHSLGNVQSESVEFVDVVWLVGHDFPFRGRFETPLKIP